MDPTWIVSLKERLKSKCVVDDRTGCVLWRGAVWSGTRYGRYSVKYPNGQRKEWRVHRLILAIYMNTNLSASSSSGSGSSTSYSNTSTVHLILPTHTPDHRPLEVSHLCHTPECINPQHLSLETHITNMERQHCVRQGHCSKDHNPHCLIH